MAKVIRLPTAAKRRVRNPDLPEDPRLASITICETSIAGRAGRRPWLHQSRRDFHLFDPTKEINVKRRPLFQLRRRRG